MKFSDIPAHEIVKQRLREMVDQDRIPHAILLEGPSGIGKFATARAFTQYIHCENRTPDGDSCGKCASCIQHQTFNHVDTHYVFPVVKLEKMTTPPISDDFIAQWREYLESNMYMDFDKWVTVFDKKNAQPVTYVSESSALLHKLSFTTHSAKYKVVLWWLPERMNEEAANKLLKMIEEPFSDTIFIMVSNNHSGILPTIYSRVQRIEMRRLPDNVISEILIQKHGLDKTDAMAIAHISEGSIITAHKNIERGGDNELFLKSFIEFMRLAYQRKIRDLREWANNLSGLGRETEIRFYDYTMRLIRENFILNFKTPSISYLSTAEQQFSINFARFINERNVEKLMSVFDNARNDIAGNANGKIVNLDVAIKVILLLKS